MLTSEYVKESKVSFLKLAKARRSSTLNSELIKKVKDQFSFLNINQNQAVPVSIKMLMDFNSFILLTRQRGINLYDFQLPNASTFRALLID